MAAAGYYVRYFGGDWGRAFQLALLFAALLLLGLLGLSGSIRAKFRVLVGKHFFSYRYDYREEWLRFTSTLSSQDGFSEMGQHVVKGLADMVESPAGALWLKDPTSRFFAQAACWNMPVSSATEDADSGLCKFLIDSGWIINLEEYRSLPRRYDRLDIPGWLVEVPNAWLVVPLATGNEMIGFVVLATARTKIDVNWEVNDLLKTAGRQAGAFLGQMQATEALLEVRKFDAFNRMSAFVVHDLKNIVAQLSLMLKNAERHRDNPEFQQDMLMTVEHSVERMRQLMMQLREGATPVDSPRGIDLGDVIRRIRTAKSGQGRDLDIDLTDKVVAKGHEDRIERVIGHIVQNALDATDNGGRVWVRLARQGAHAVIEVGDTGHGMSPEFLRERLFKPFQTTKPAGMGIGAYESFQYVHELGGKVSVDSAVNVGTQVSLLLPLFDTGAGMDSGLLPKESE
jgi:putative PEP-CTERM system histidine kinase